MTHQPANLLEQASLLDLAAGGRSLIRLPGFLPAEVGKPVLEALRTLIQVRSHPYYSAATRGIEFLGLRYSSKFDSGRQDEYFDQARQVADALRLAATGHASPLELLVDTLSRCWPAGCEVAAMEGRTMAPCAIRMVQSGAEIEPHQDDTPRGIDQLLGKTGVVTLAINLFLQTSRVGGELEIWNRSFTPTEYQSLQKLDSYALDRTRMAEPYSVIVPADCDLIILNANRVHAVRAVGEGERCTMSCFLAMADLQTPLVIWA